MICLAIFCFTGKVSKDIFITDGNLCYNSNSVRDKIHEEKEDELY